MAELGAVATCERVCFGYTPSTTILNDISFSVSRGRLVSIVGPSGSGKTTLLSILGGFLKPTSGSISYCWRHDHAAISPIAWVLQTTNIFPNRSVAANIAVPAQLAGAPMSEVHAAARRVAEHLEIDHLLTAKARTLSGGEVQRVGIARALVSGAELVLADEPTGQLDDRATEFVVSQLRELAANPASGSPAIVIVTHDMSVASECDDRYVLRTSGLERW